MSETEPPTKSESGIAGDDQEDIETRDANIIRQAREQPLCLDPVACNYPGGPCVEPSRCRQVKADRVEARSAAEKRESLPASRIWICENCQGWNERLSGQCWRCGAPKPEREAAGALSPDQLAAALHREHDQLVRYTEIRERVEAGWKRLELAAERGEEAAGDPRATESVRLIVADALALIEQIDALLRQNERLSAFLLGLNEAGIVSQGELELIFGLGKD